MILKLTKIKMLAAASLLALPAAAGAQSTIDAGGAVDASAGAQTQPPLPDPTPPAEAMPDQTVPDVVDEALPPDPTPEPDAEVPSEADVDTGLEADAQADQSATGEAGPVTAATETDVQAGAAVLDTEGGMVGTIESVEADGAVIATGSVRAKLPISSFGKSDRGLVISLTRAQLEAAASQQDPT